MTKFLNDTGLGTLISLIKGEINDKKSIYIGTSPSGDASKKDKTATTNTFPTVTENNVTKPKTGTIVGIKFLASNTYKTANSTYTLNVNSTGAYPMYYNNAELATSTSANTLVAGYKNRYCYYVFNGSQWVWLTASYDANTTYSAMTQAEITAGTGTTGRVLTPALLRSNFYTEGEVDEKLPLVVNFTESNNVVTCDTSIADIYAAYSAGREVVGHIDGGQVNLFACTENTTLFYWIYGDAVNYIIGSTNTNDNSDSWTHTIEYIQEKLTFDSTPTASSSNPVTSGGVKTALDGKQDKNLLITLTHSNNSWSADKTYTEIEAAYNAGKNLFLTDGEYFYILQYYAGTNSSFYFNVLEGDNYNSKVFYVDSSDSWEYDQHNYQAQLTFDNIPTANSNNPVKSGGIKTALDGKQDTLVSGTNIKTVNSQTLLGSGDILLNAATIGTSPSGNYDGDPIEEVLDEKQDSLVSGTNIKTVNNNSLLGSGDVQVGDITGEELETEIEELESTLLTDALRKSEQVLLPAEKTQVLTNLGIADVVTQGNLKTVNSASLVGTGNIEIVSTNVGDVTIEQGIGDSQTTVMSQKAVSEQVERLTSNDLGSLENLTRERRLPYGYDELDWIYNGAAGSGGVIDTGLIPDDANWVFEGSFYIVGNASESYAYIISAYSAEAANAYRIIRNGSSNVALYVNAHSRASGGVSSVNIQQQKWYNFGLKQGSLILNGTNNTINTTTGTTLTSTMQLGGRYYPVRLGEFTAYHNEVLVADLVPCKHGEDVGMYDIVRGQFFVSTNANNFIAGDFASAGKNRLVTGEGLASLIAQEAGDSEVKLMSQKAVTDEVRKVVAADLAGTSTWIREQLTNAGWVFGKYLTGDGAYTTSTAQPYVITHVIPVDYNVVGHTLIFKYNNNKNTSSYINWYTANGRAGCLNGLNSNTQQSLVIPTNNTNYNNLNGLRFTVNADDIPNCSIYDSTSKKYIWEGAKYLYDFIKDFSINVPWATLLNNVIAQELGTFSQKAVSQKVITEQFDAHDYIDKRYTYMNGALCGFALDDYPNIDVREAEGISLVMDGENVAVSYNAPLLVISNSGSISSTNPMFLIHRNWSSPYVGFMIGWTSPVSGQGTSFPTNKTYNKWAHQVITFDFNTGESNIYVNGVLWATATVANFDKNAFRTALRAQTHMYLSAPTSSTNSTKITGLAVFPRAITASEVTKLFGAGGDETRGSLIPNLYNAYDMLAHPFTTWNLNWHTQTADVTTNENGGKNLTLRSGQTYMLFGFTGLSSKTSFYHIIDFDFTVVSGSCKFNLVQYNNNVFTSPCTITDSNGDVVDFANTTLTAGNTYHMRCVPTLPYNPSSYGALNVGFLFSAMTEGTVLWIHESVVIRERGAALKLLRENFRGTYWELYNSYQIPIRTSTAYSSNTAFAAYYDPFKQNTVIYNSSVSPQFNGQMAVDSANSRVYVGILNVNGGTWKQINNS